MRSKWSTLIPVAAVAVALPAPALAAPPPVYLPETGTIPSVATTVDAAGTLVNPAGLGWDSGLSLNLASAGLSSTSLAFGFGATGLALRMEGARQELTLSTALPFTDSFRGGLSYRLGRLGATTGGDWDASFLARPTDFLSIGGAVRNIGGMLPGEPRNYQLGVAVRPGTDRVTLSLDGAWAEGRRIDQAEPMLGADFEIADNLFVRGEALFDPLTDDLTGRIGLSIGSPTWTLGGLSAPLSSAGTGIAGTSGYVRFDEARSKALVGLPVVAELKLSGDLGPGPSAFAVLTGMSAMPPVAATLEALRKTAEDPHIVALVVKISNVSASLADVEEVRNALAAVHAAGKPVIAYLPSAGFPELFLASACDQVLLNPVGTVDFTGFATEVQYYRPLMDKLGIKAEFVKAGPYKDAMEPFERKTMSAANREQLDALTGDQFEQILDGIAQGRHQATDDILVDVNQGFLSAPQALDAKLVDKLAEPEDLKAALDQLHVPTASGRNAQSLLYRIRSWAPAHIAIVNLSGAIAQGMGGSDLLMGQTIGSSILVRALNDARDDGSIRGVVLRIDSPGGDAIASEAIRDAVARLARVKPVVVSMGGEAASGGYWVACGADRLLADPATITGSIGVFVGKFSASGLFHKLGIHTDDVSRGKYATLDSIAHDLTPDQEQLMTSNMEFTYARFLELVSHARHMTQTHVKDLAGGHIWSGATAAKLGLVDGQGGLLDAIAEVRHETGLEHQEVVIDYLPVPGPFGLSSGDLDVFDGTFGLGHLLARSAAWGRTNAWLLDPRLVGTDRP